MTAARGFKQSFENLLARIGEHPKLVPVAFRKRGIGGVRLRLVPGFENYIVFYTIRKDEARVLRVTHGAQDWQSMMGVSLTPDEEDA